MPNRIPDSDVELVPADLPADAAHDDDFYTWSLEQARLVREGHWDALDRKNVADEIESLGRQQFSKLRSVIRILVLHMLKWDRQPERRSRLWELSIRSMRIDLEDVLDGNPGLQPRIQEAIRGAYRKARIEAAQETELDLGQFSELCPYSWEDITGRDFLL
jgi:hypothetical protein